MTEYLKREDVRRAVLHNEGDAVIAAIDELEPLEIVQCRDCIYYRDEHAFCTNDAIDNSIRMILPNWFCGDGKRKDGTA